MTVRGLDDVERMLRDAARDARDLRPVLDPHVSATISDFFRRQFATHGAAGGTPWAPLTPVTLAWKGRHHRGSMGPLRFTNRLWASLVKRSAPEGVRIVQPQSLEQGTTVEAATFAQEGFTQTRVWGRLRERHLEVEPRELVPDELPRSLVKGWESLLVRHLEGG